MTQQDPNSRWTRLILSTMLAAVPTVGMADAVGYLRVSVAPRYQLAMNEATFAQTNIDRGRAILNQVMAGSYDHLTSQETDGADVVAVMWALFDAGVAKGQGYEQGSFVVEDGDWRLYDFLRGNHGAHARHSSHLALATRLTSAGHHGIDILGSYQAGSAQWAPFSALNPAFVQQNILPARKGTILFVPMQAGQHVGLATNQVFIKMEDHGMRTWYGYANHAWDFLTGTCLGLGVDPNEAARKERIDKHLLKRYLDLIKVAPGAHCTTGTAQAKDLGVRMMIAEANRLNAVAQDNPAFQGAFAAFTAAVAAKNYDNLAMRTGDEVIFTRAELHLAINRHQGGAQAHAADADSSDWVIDMPEALESDSAGADLREAPLAVNANSTQEAGKGFLGTLSSWLW